MTPPTPPHADLLIELLKRQFDIDAPIDADTPFDSLDLDSLVLVEFAVTLSQHYGIDITDEELEHAGTINGTIQLLKDKAVSNHSA